MKYFTTTALAALLVGGMSALAFIPAASADDVAAPAAPAATQPAAPPDDQVAAADDGTPGWAGPMGRMMMRGPMGMGGAGMRGNLFNIACGDRGAEALEIAFVRINYAVKPTADQQPLLDALKSTALADQKTFAAACKTAIDSAKADGTATILDRLETRLTLDQARVAALSDVLPKFKAFYDSLTADQKAKLEPQNRVRMGFNGWGHPGWQQWHRFGPGRMGPGQMGPGQMRGPAAGNPGNAPAAPAPQPSGGTSDTQS